MNEQLTKHETDSLERLADAVKKLSPDGMKRISYIAEGMAIQKEIESEKPKQ
jgi:hypothetical protein